MLSAVAKPRLQSASELRAWQRSKTFVRVHRSSLEQGHVTGRIVGSSTKLLALATIGETRPDGFEVFRRADVSRLQAPDPYADFVEAALRLRGETLPRFPKIDLGSWRSVVTGAARRFPLVTLHTELRDPDVCFIGRPIRLTTRGVTLHTIAPGAVWDDERTFAWADLTRVEFGGVYEDALALVAASRA